MKEQCNLIIVFLKFSRNNCFENLILKRKLSCRYSASNSSKRNIYFCSMLPKLVISVLQMVFFHSSLVFQNIFLSIFVDVQLLLIVRAVLPYFIFHLCLRAARVSLTFFYAIVSLSKINKYQCDLCIKCILWCLYRKKY